MAENSMDVLARYYQYFDRGVVYDIPAKIFRLKKYAPIREYALSKMGFSVVTKRNCEILAQIINYQSVLEVMCGLGSYTATLRSVGVPVIATDDFSWIECDESKYQSWKQDAWVKDIIHCDAVSAIKKFGKEVSFVLMSWPPQHEIYAADALKAMREVNRNCRMIYVGEERGGVTANEDFFNEMNDVSEQYEKIRDLRMSYHSWSNEGYYDKQFILQ